MSNADWANKDFYKVLGVAKDADQATIKKAYRKLARANHPDSKPGRQGRRGAVQAGRRGLRRRRRRREAQGVRRDALDVRRARAPAAAAASPAASARAAAARAAASTSPTCSATCSPRRWRRRWLRHRHPGAPRAAAGADIETEATHRLRRRDRRHHDQPAAELRRAVPDLLGHRRQARHPAARLPHCDGAGVVVSSVGGGVLDERDLPGVPRPPAGRTTSRARPATAPAAACPTAPSRPASPPGSRTASGSG